MSTLSSLRNHPRLYGEGTYKSADEANEAFTEMEARGEEVEYVEVDLPAMERQGRVFYVDGKKKPDHFKKKTKKNPAPRGGPCSGA